ncbi:MAG: type III-A CRISPR-associated RAMP protein Csm4 [Hydrogenobacter thermophilus]|uniref:type III-A CRISPR-associated RAMP protein Csm4 n=1 Tax=Hydrogenobacter thermophilus TaxID=940 RepID=UPI001C790016|nr:type III-A CRISPR-associated RAMP protein Csm4 [Hydrogenobacter thermophilus]QWK20608.1 MAG: type III-A CRISPR-associated RAMP protein Csm4 [Hydrogenobacter thermophilus]
MLLRAVFKPRSLFRGFPQVWTVFGAICWGVRVLYGEGRLSEMIEAFREKPPFILTSPLPYTGDRYVFPKPILPNRWEEPDSQEEYSLRKKVKGLRYVPEDIFRKILDGEIRTNRELLGLLKEYKEDNYVAELVVPHASISRITWTTTGGELYNEEVTAMSPFIVLFKFYSQDFVEEVKASLRFAQLGGNKSTGMGYFEVSFEEEKELRWLEDYMTSKTGRFVSLSPLLYSDSLDLEDSFYEPLTFTGAVDNYYGWYGRPIWKDRVIYLSEGSNLKVKEEKDFYGAFEKVMEYGGDTVYQYGYAFPLFVRWES